MARLAASFDLVSSADADCFIGQLINKQTH
jgi:hypothetical protein